MENGSIDKWSELDWNWGFMKLLSNNLRKRGNEEPSRAGDWKGEHGSTRDWSGGQNRRPSVAASLRRSPSLEAPFLFPTPTLSLHSLPPLLSRYTLPLSPSRLVSGVRVSLSRSLFPLFLSRIHIKSPTRIRSWPFILIWHQSLRRRTFKTADFFLFHGIFKFKLLQGIWTQLWAGSHQ